jgi:hypothetical protein
MKKLTVLIAMILISCGGLNRSMMGTTEKDLIKQVSIEQNCSKENIKVIDSHKSMGNATYALMVCGKRMCYTQVGSVLMECSQKDKLLNKKKK